MTTAIHPNDIRPETRAAWEALTAEGLTPSIRAVHVRVGGSYPLIAEECRILREAANPQWPPAVRQAVYALYEALRTDDEVYRHYISIAQYLQGSARGLLTNVIDAIRAEEE